MKTSTVLAALLGAATLLHTPAFAQSDSPNIPVMLITAFAPGSGPDATLWLVKQRGAEAVKSFEPEASGKRLTQWVKKANISLE